MIRVKFTHPWKDKIVGDEVDLTDAIALALIESGMVENISRTVQLPDPDQSITKESIKFLDARISGLERTLIGLRVQRDFLLSRLKEEDQKTGASVEDESSKETEQEMGSIKTARRVQV